MCFVVMIEVDRDCNEDTKDFRMVAVVTVRGSEVTKGRDGKNSDSPSTPLPYSSSASSSST